MGTNNNRSCFTQMQFGDLKNYQKPEIWVAKLEQFRMICETEGNTNPGGGANEDHSTWDEEEIHSLWE